jgi:iron(III) transport system permease protein
MTIALPRSDMSARARTWWRLMRGNMPFILVTGLLLFLILVPVIRLLINSFQLGHPALPQGWTLDNYAHAFASPLFYEALTTTLWVSSLSTVITVSIAVLFAWLIERTDMPLRNLAWALILIPMAIPGVLFALSWTLLLTPKTGAINVVLRDILQLIGIGLQSGPFNIYSMSGLIFLDGLRGVTTVFLLVVGAFRMMDPSLEEAARVSKAGAMATFFRVTLPALTPALLAATMYCFISSMESFEAPLAVGLPAKIYMLSTLIYFTVRIQAPIDYGLSAVYGVSFMVLMIALLVFYRRAMRHSERFSTVTGKGFRPRTISIGKWRHAALAMFVVYFLLAVVAPFAILVWCSLLPSYRVPSQAAMKLISLANYREIFETPQVLSVIWNTAVLMLVTATVTMATALVVSWVIVRTKISGRGILDGLVFVPHAIPGIVIALAMMMAYLSPPLIHTGIYGTLAIIIMALVVSYIAFGTRLMNSAIMQIHKELEQVAYVSGATRLGTLFAITLPLLLPAFVAGWIWVAVHALRAFSIPLMLGTKRTEVYAVLLWDYWEEGSAPTASALGVLLILVLIPLSLAMRRFVMRVSAQQG